MAQRLITAFRSVFTDYFSLKGYVEDQASIEDEIRQGVSFKGSNVYILIFAILVASLGLNTNSTAVIIGAMLISPLMGPIIGVGLGVGIEDFDLLRRSLRNLVMAAGISVIASTIYFLISPVAEGHSELLARTSPSIYDVLIAFFGGAAGIIGMSARSKGNVIPGVAIATALMPPLCTVGYGVATFQPHYFLGATYLFLINSIFIALATFIGVKILKFQQTKLSDPVRATKVRRWVYTVAILTLLPSIYLTYNMYKANTYTLNAQRFVNTEMTFPDTQVLSQRAYSKNGHRILDVTLLGKVLPTDSLLRVLTPRLDNYGLKGVSLNIIQSGAAFAPKVTDGSVMEVYNAAQQAIVSKQIVIDSLRNVVASINHRDTMGVAMAPELKVVFPQVSRISVSKNVVCNIETGKKDTLDLAIVGYSRKISSHEQAQLKEYLEARLNVKNLTIVEL